MAYLLGWLRRNVYSTAFPLTENPISEGSRWTNGGAVGLDWQNIRTDGTSAFGAGTSASYNDCIACLSGFGATSHYAQATCHRVGGYSPGVSHECELLTGWTISAHLAKGYECTWDIGSSTCQLVRWNGAAGDFTIQGGSDDNLGGGKGWTDTPSGSGGSNLAHGDVVKVVYQVSGGNVTLTVYKNGAQVLTCQDTSANKITSGQPGMGLFGRPGATMSSFCWSNFEAG